jgi:hypothetical protein
MSAGMNLRQHQDRQTKSNMQFGLLLVPRQQE